MIDFSYLEIVDFLRNFEKGRAAIGFLDRSNGTFVIGLFHDTDPVNVMAKIAGFTAYGYLTYMTHIIPKKEELIELLELYKKDVNDANFWWESDEGVPYSEDVLKMAEYLNGDIGDDELDEDIFERLLEQYKEPNRDKSKPKEKPKLTLIKTENEDEK